jgi:hypothetical protein
MSAAHPPVRVFIAITGALAVAFACATAPQYLFGADSARYIAVARSLAEGSGYALFGQPERIFPPGFPLVLTPAALLAGDSFATLARWAAMVGALVFPATYAFARRGNAALPVAVLTVFSAGFLELIVGNPRSEPAYMVCSLGLIAWAHRGASRPERAGRRAYFIAAGTALLLMTVATRSIGVAAVGAAVMLLLERVIRPSARSLPFPKEFLLPLAAATAFVFAWFMWTRAAPDAEADPSTTLTYVQQLLLADPHRPDLGLASPLLFLTRAIRNLVIQASHAAELVTQLPWLKPRWFSPVAAAVLALTVWGWSADFRSRSRFAAWYFLGYAAIVLLWPFDEGTRFLVPILPFLWLYGIAGAGRAIGAVSSGSRRLRLGLILVATICLLGAAASLAADPADFSRQDQAFALVWLLVLGVAAFGWSRAARWTAAISSRAGRSAAIAAMVLYVTAGVARTVPEAMAGWRDGALSDPVAEALREASRWISGNTPAESTIQASFRTQIQFATGRTTVRFPITGSPEIHRRYLEAYRPDYLIVLGGTVAPYYQPVDSVKFTIVQQLFPGAWREAVQLRGSAIYEYR